MKRLLLIPLLICGLGSQAQTSLDQVLATARQNSPLSQQPALTREISSLEDARLKSQWLPGMAINAQGTYQSDVITFPENPMFTFPSLPQAQYRATLDVQQPIYEGGKIAAARQLNLLSQQINTQQVEVDLAGMERQITQQYFAVLQAEMQQDVARTTLEYLAERRKSIEHAIENGVVLPGALASLDQQVLMLRLQIQQLEAGAKSQREALSVLCGDEGLVEAELALPEGSPSQNLENERPELQAFQLQQAMLGQQGEVLSRNLRPTLAAFASGGVGQPNPYNFLETDFDGFYMVGLRLNWAPWDWNRTQRQQQQLELQQQQIDLTQERFTQGVDAQVAGLRAQQASIQGQLELGEEMETLQTKLVKQAEQQVDLGTLTPAEYLAEVNTLTRLRQEQQLRELQILHLEVQIQQVLGQ